MFQIVTYEGISSLIFALVKNAHIRADLLLVLYPLALNRSFDQEQRIPSLRSIE